MISPALFQKYASDPAAFRNDLFVDVAGQVRNLGQVIDPWQVDDFADLDPAILHCVGRIVDDPSIRKRGWWERPRGHSKTSDTAIICAYALAFATHPIRSYCYAADLDQANLLRDALLRLVRLNPWLGEILEVQKNLVVNIGKNHPGEGSRLDISTSNVPTSWGILPSIIIADEYAHWQGDGSLWHSILSSAAKRSDCVLLVVTNAGFTESLAWSVREAVRHDPSWIFSRLDGPKASWMSPKLLDEQRRLLPPTAFGRLWLNNWSTGGGDALREEDVRVAFRPELQPMTGRERDWKFVAGVDLGLTRDHTAVVVLAVPMEGGKGGVIQLADHRIWVPEKGKKINLPDIERHIQLMDEKYDLVHVGFDPWQAEHMAQRLDMFSQHKSRRSRWASTRNKPWMVQLAPTATVLRQIASLTIESFTDRRMRLYECEPLRRDLLRLRAEEKSYGLRLTSPRDAATGHGDTFSAFANALVIAHEVAGQKTIVIGAELGNDDDWAERWERRQEEFRQHAEILAAMPDDDFNPTFFGED